MFTITNYNYSYNYSYLSTKLLASSVCNEKFVSTILKAVPVEKYLMLLLLFLPLLLPLFFVPTNSFSYF